MVKRYDCDYPKTEHPQGGWVSWEDYEALEEKLKRSFKAEPLTGYEGLGGQSPRPIKLSAIQQIRDAVDPMGEETTGIRHMCERCGPCVDDGKVVSGEHVRCLLQHIDYLQGQLDAVDKARVDYFGSDDGSDYG